MSFPHCFFSVGYYKLNSTGFENRGEDRNTAGLIQIKTRDLQLPPPCSMPYGFFQELDREETLLFKNIFLILYKCTCCLPTFPLRQKVREYNGLQIHLISYLMFIFQSFPTETISGWVNHTSQYLSKECRKIKFPQFKQTDGKRCAIYTKYKSLQ